MIVNAMVSFNGGTHGLQESFRNDVSIDFMVRQFESEVNRANETSGSAVLFMDKLVENPDGTPKLNLDGSQIVERIYTSSAYSELLSEL